MIKFLAHFLLVPLALPLAIVFAVILALCIILMYAMAPFFEKSIETSLPKFYNYGQQ